MRFVLVNPNWQFEGSVYFGCRERHLPLEFGYSKAILEQNGHECLLLDAQEENLSPEGLRGAAGDFKPDFTVITTAPSYLFWRCPPPELKVPIETAKALRGMGKCVVVGSHASITPQAAGKKLSADIVLRGEFEGVLHELASVDHSKIPSACLRERGFAVQGPPHAMDLSALPALRWPVETIRLHTHQHHRFDTLPDGPGAEVEASRGCPFTCTFCAKQSFRDKFRKRPFKAVLDEIDGLVSAGAEYIYFIDEIFMPDQALLGALRERKIRFGIQTRIDLWEPEALDLLGAAGCVSIEAGVESISEQGRDRLNKRCRMTNLEMMKRLIHARVNVPFVQATLLDSGADEPEDVEAWRRCLQGFGVWANKPVPLFPYPGTMEYERLWGAPDEEAWERAHGHYINMNINGQKELSDIQDPKPISIRELECAK